METSNLSHTEVKTLVITMLKKLRGRMERLSENLKIETEMKNAITEMTNTLEEINSRLNEAQDQFSDLKDKVA